jgi:hypothetical protein
VADYVAALTKDKRLPEAKRERAYFAQLARAALARPPLQDRRLAP